MAFQQLTFVVDSSPKAVRLGIYFHEDLVQRPLPVGKCPQVLGAPFPHLGRKHLRETVPPEPDAIMSHLNAPFVQQILEVSQRQWEPNVEHHRWADDFGRRFKISEGAPFCHPKQLADCPAGLKPV